MVVPGQDDIGPGLIERIPVSLHDIGTPVMSGTEARRMPVGECTQLRMSREVGDEPLALRVVASGRARAAAAPPSNAPVPGRPSTNAAVASSPSLSQPAISPTAISIAGAGVGT